MASQALAGIWFSLSYCHEIRNFQGRANAGVMQSHSNWPLRVTFLFTGLGHKFKQLFLRNQKSSRAEIWCASLIY